MAAPRTISVAAIQTSYGEDMAANIAKTIDLVREAASRGAQVILPSELFQGPYFCVSQEEKWFGEAYPWREHPCVTALQPVAADLGVAIPVSIFEREGPHYFNSLVMIDADGSLMVVYRKSHNPDGPGYQEKYYFRPGDTGFKVWKTKKGVIGVGICWDQWFPETARAMALMGADMSKLIYSHGFAPHHVPIVGEGPNSYQMALGATEQQIALLFPRSNPMQRDPPRTQSEPRRLNTTTEDTRPRHKWRGYDLSV